MNGSANRRGPSRIPLQHRMKRRFRQLTPMLVWSVVLIATVGLYFRQVDGTSVTGFAREIRYSVAPETTGRLKGLEVLLNQEVNRGQIVASFEDKELLLILQEARTELNRLAFELGVDQQTNLRRFARDAENAHIDYLEALSSLAEKRIELQGLELTLDRTRMLRENDATPLSTLDDDRIAFEAQSERIEIEETMVQAMQRAYQEADKRYHEFLNEYVMETPDIGLPLKSLENAIKVQEVRIEKANLAILRLVLRAPADGRVIEIYRRPGEVVVAGQPVVSIVEPRSTEMVAYLPEHRILDVETDTLVKLRRVAEPDRVYESWIAGVGSHLETLPVRLTPGAVAPDWGVAMYIPLPDSLAAIPGEAIEVFF